MRYYLAAYPMQDTVAFLGLGMLSPRAALFALGRPHSAQHDSLIEDRRTELLSDFLGSLSRTLESVNPVGRTLSRAAEDELNRHCYVLALLEQFYRVGRAVNSPILALPDSSGVRELLTLADPWLQDLRHLSRAFFRAFGALIAQPHVLNPTFAGSGVIGGADADFVVGRSLIEVKTTIDPVLRSILLWQILGYVLLDFDDHFHIDEVGVYMSRQALLVRWPLQTFMEQLAGRPMDLATARRDFERMLRGAGLGIDEWSVEERSHGPSLDPERLKRRPMT